MSQPVTEVALSAGVARCDITPPPGIEMGGFGRRVQPSVGVRDPLFAKALVLDDGSERVVIVSCDLLGFSYDYDARLREAIARTGTAPAGNIMVACTHNHAGPATQFLRNCGLVDEAWMQALAGLIVATVQQAAMAMRPVTVEFARGRAGLSHDRRAIHHRTDDGARQTTATQVEPDPRISVVRFRNGADVVADVLHYACHPVTMLWENRDFSAEFCGAACSHLERESGAPALFLNGACGDVNPLLEAVGGSLIPVTEYEGRAYGDTLWFGEALGQVALEALKSAAEIASPRLGAELRAVAVPLQIPSLAEIDATAEFFSSHSSVSGSPDGDESETWSARTYSAWAACAREALRLGTVTPNIKVSLQKISIGEVTLVGVGGEVFSQIGAEVRALVGEPCLVVGYANGNMGYLPSREAFDEGGYEVEEAGNLYGLFGVGPDSAETLLDQMRSWQD